jgi:hypothetical protein
MDPTVVTIVVIAAVALVVVGLVALLVKRKESASRTEHLQQRFGPEYDRTVADSEDHKQAEARLQRTEERREQLDIRPLTAAARDRRVQQWESVQAMFVDAPVEATDGAGRLVTDVMAERGYPTRDSDDRMQMLAADHADNVDNFRTAESLRSRFHSGEGSTEDLRRAFVEYRRLFDVLVDDGVDRSQRDDAQASQRDDAQASQRDDAQAVHPDRPDVDERRDVVTDPDARDSRPAGTHGEHAAGPVDEVDLRDRRDPAPAPTPVAGDRDRTAHLDDGR